MRGVTGRGVYIDAKLHDVSRPAGMCLTDGQILTGQGRDGAPFSRIREEEFDGNPGNERGIERGWDWIISIARFLMTAGYSFESRWYRVQNILRNVSYLERC